MLCVCVNFFNFGCTYYIRFVGYVSVTMWVLQLHREIELWGSGPWTHQTRENTIHQKYYWDIQVLLVLWHGFHLMRNSQKAVWCQVAWTQWSWFGTWEVGRKCRRCKVISCKSLVSHWIMRISCHHLLIGKLIFWKNCICCTVLFPLFLLVSVEKFTQDIFWAGFFHVKQIKIHVHLWQLLWKFSFYQYFIFFTAVLWGLASNLCLL